MRDLFSCCPGRPLALLVLLLAAFFVRAQQPPLTDTEPVKDLQKLSQHHPDSAFLLLKTRMAEYQEENNALGEAICLQKMGQILYHSGSYSQAVENHLLADKIFRSLKRDDLLAANLNSLGLIYYYNQQPGNAWTQFREAYTIYKQRKDASGIAYTYSQIGHMYEKQQLYDSATYFQRKALEFALSVNDRQVLPRIYENLGSILEDREAYDSARYYFELSLQGYRQTGNLLDQIEVINNLGDMQSKTGHFSEGLILARQAMQMAAAVGELYQQQSAYRDMAQCFAGLNMYDSAYHYLEQSRALVQRIYGTETSKRITLLQTLYDTERKNTEITRLNASRKVNYTVNIAAVVVVILLVLSAILVISRQKLKIKNEQALNESNQRIFETQTGLMESELKRQQLEEGSLKQKLEVKSRELSSHLLHLIQKNEVMEELKQGLTAIINDDKRDQKKQIRQLLQKINLSFVQDSYWEEFRLIFNQVHPSFITSLQQLCPELTPGELRLLALLKMNLAATDMSTLLGITPDSLRVTRYRTKKKLNIQGESLSSFIQSIS